MRFKLAYRSLKTFWRRFGLVTAIVGPLFALTLLGSDLQTGLIFLGIMWPIGIVFAELSYRLSFWVVLTDDGLFIREHKAAYWIEYKAVEKIELLSDHVKLHWRAKRLWWMADKKKTLPVERMETFTSELKTRVEAAKASPVIVVRR